MKNKGKKQANKKNTDKSIWNYDFEWPDVDIKWNLPEIEWPEIDFKWSMDEYLGDNKKNSENNVRKRKKS